MFEGRRRRVIRNRSGQSTIEFALMLILLMSFILFFFQLSMVFAFGNFAHYATFMAARAYLAGGPDVQEQTARAQSVIASMVKRSAAQPTIDRFPSIAKGEGDSDARGVMIAPPGNYNPLDPDYAWLQGVRYKFTSRIFLVPLAGLGKGRSGDTGRTTWNKLTLTSESWLGREPTDTECRSTMSKKAWAFDNGC